MRTLALLLATMIAEAWCSPQVDTRTYCLSCDLGQCHYGQQVPGCQCDCNGQP